MSTCDSLSRTQKKNSIISIDSTLCMIIINLKFHYYCCERVGITLPNIKLVQVFSMLNFCYGLNFDEVRFGLGLGMLYQVWWWWIKSMGVYNKLNCLLLFLGALNSEMSLWAACVILCVGVYSCHCDMAQKTVNKDNYFNKWIFGKSKDVDQK